MKINAKPMKTIAITTRRALSQPANQCKPLKNNEQQWKSFENYWKPLEIIENNWKPLKIIENQCNFHEKHWISIKINETNGNHWKPVVGVGGMGGASKYKPYAN